MVFSLLCTMGTPNFSKWTVGGDTISFLEGLVKSLSSQYGLRTTVTFPSFTPKGASQAGCLSVCSSLPPLSSRHLASALISALEEESGFERLMVGPETCSNLWWTDVSILATSISKESFRQIVLPYLRTCPQPGLYGLEKGSLKLLYLIQPMDRRSLEDCEGLLRGERLDGVLFLGPMEQAVTLCQLIGVAPDTPILHLKPAVAPHTLPPSVPSLVPHPSYDCTVLPSPSAEKLDGQSLKYLIDAATMAPHQRFAALHLTGDNLQHLPPNVAVLQPDSVQALHGCFRKSRLVMEFADAKEGHWTNPWPSPRLLEAASCRATIAKNCALPAVDYPFVPHKEMLFPSKPEALVHLLNHPCGMLEQVSKRALEHLLREHTLFHRARRLYRFLQRLKNNKVPLS